MSGMFSIEAQEQGVRDRAWLESHGFRLEMNANPIHYSEPCPICHGLLREDSLGGAYLVCSRCGWKGL